MSTDTQVTMRKYALRLMDVFMKEMDLCVLIGKLTT